MERITLMPTDFEKSVWKILGKIPRGRVSTYKEIACALGRPAAYRAVGNACNRNPNAPEVPCHRIVKEGGFLGGFAKGAKKKEELLKSEGIKIKNNKILSFSEKKIKAGELW